MTEQALLSFLARLHPDTTAARNDHQKVWRKLILFFDSNGCMDSDARADVTIDGVARKLVEGEIIHHKWLYGVANNVLSEHKRSAAAKQHSLDSASALTGTAVTPASVGPRISSRTAGSIVCGACLGSNRRWSFDTISESREQSGRIRPNA